MCVGYNLNLIIEEVMTHKLTQAEIDELARDSQQQKQNVQEEYAMDHETVQSVDQQYQFSKQEEEIQEKYGQSQNQRRSEIEQQNLDQVLDQSGHMNSSVFKKDDDLSQAKSEFIESQQLKDQRLLQIKSKIKKPNQDKSIKKETKTPKDKTIQNKIRQKGVVKEKVAKKKQVKEKKSEKMIKQQQKPQRQKVTKEQIVRRLQEIQNSKKEMLRKKQQKVKRQQEERRKQYEEAKKIEQQKRQKNKKIFEEQLKSKSKNESKVQSRSQLESQIKIPEKRNQYKYGQFKKERLQNEKLMQKMIQQQNKKKLKKLNQNPSKQIKGIQKKMAILQQRKYAENIKKREKNMQVKQQDTLIIKQLKKQIVDSRRNIKQKNEQINRAEKTIKELSQKLKIKQKLLYNESVPLQEKQMNIQNVNDFSSLSPIERFVFSFPEAKGVQQIFSQIDQNKDGILSSEEIRNKLIQLNIEEELVAKIEQILDENSDGTVSKDQFVFYVQQQLKKQKDYKQILGELDIINPIDIEIKILDMQAKIKFLRGEMEGEGHKEQNEKDGKIARLQKKAEQMQAKMDRQMKEYQKQGKKMDLGVNHIKNLTNEILRLKNDKEIKGRFVVALRRKVHDNLKEKNRVLGSRVQESLRLQEEIYKIKNEIQERQLKYLSLKKIQQNKKGYLERQTENRKDLEEAFRKNKEYQIMISDPGRKATKTAQMDELKLLAAVLMIQRNYRKRKARIQVQKLKQQQSKK